METANGAIGLAVPTVDSNSSIEDVKLLTDENEQLQKRFLECRSECDSLRAALAEYESTLQLALYRVEDSSSTQCALLQDRVNLVNKSNSRLTSDYKTVVRSFQDLQTKYENLKLDTNANAENVKLLKDENQELRQKMSVAEDKFQSMRQVFETKLATMKERVAEEQAKTAESERRAADLEEAARAKDDMVAQARGDLVKANNTITDARRECDMLRMKVDSAQRAAEDAESSRVHEARRVESARQTIAQLQAKLATEGERYSDAQETITGLNGELGGMKQLQAQNEQLQKEIEAQKVELNAVKVRAFDAAQELERQRIASASGGDEEWKERLQLVVQQAERYRAERDEARTALEAKETERVQLVELCNELVGKLEATAAEGETEAAE
ncbi:Chromosome partition protein Smc [Carpediemonas membranifera]|uniref:Chromosome partition protein Smc n=1 Tax=Carpediemonas membranifera TaxID=201153 RepID=A0A8J6AYL3_9EUKA|nr:Chromosome partition protein Smc [Carpediemonas membranifera]|eukprot:KAG9390424.1 Chromosome partition protein Smc [Carpediemonas membranifera]